MLIALMYAFAFTSLVAGAAAALEWALQGRLPTRHVWSVVIALAVLVPTATVAWKSVRSRDVVAHGAVATASGPTQRVMMSLDPSHARDTQRTLIGAAAGSRTVSGFLAAGWLVLSIALAAWAAAGVARWHRLRSGWQMQQMDGVEVHVSPATGPAVLGILTQRIVVPAWAASLRPEQRQLMLAHECEHVRARDPQRLALALGALILMPWNAALWWCAARLRRAIEMDCDARVLKQYPRAKEYGYLLLEVAARGRNSGALAVPLVGLLRLPSELELRLKAMTRPRSIAVRTLATGAIGATIAIVTAFAAPVPAVELPTATTIAAKPASSKKLVTAAASSVARAAIPIARGERIVRLKADSVTNMTYEVLPPSLHDTLPSPLPLPINASKRTFMTVVSTERAPDSSDVDSRLRAITMVSNAGGNVARLQATMALQTRRIDGAIARYYPGVTPFTAPSTRIWFVANAAGDVIASQRDEGGDGSSTDELRAKFPSIDPGAMRFMSIEKRNVNGNRIDVVWVELKS